MEQKQRDKLLALLSDDEDFDWLKDSLQYDIDQYHEYVASGFVHTESLAEYLLRNLMWELQDPKIKAQLVNAEFMRSALRQARDKVSKND